MITYYAAAAAAAIVTAMQDPNISSSSSSIHELAGQGNAAAVQACIDSGTAVDSRDDQGCTALHFAADRGQMQMLQLLLAAGANINAQVIHSSTRLVTLVFCLAFHGARIAFSATAAESWPTVSAFAHSSSTSVH